MPVMNLLVAFNGSEASAAALRYAANLAKGKGVHVTAILAHSSHEVIDRSSRWITGDAKALLARTNQDIVDGIAARFDALRNELALGGDLSFIEKSGRVDATLAEAARYFDMIIVGRHMDQDDEHVSVHPDRVALLSGRPVVVVPERYHAAEPHSHAALAWDGSRSAARALSDSLRILEAQGKVSVIPLEERTSWPISSLIAHLQRHAVQPILEDLPEGRSVADRLLSFCQRNDPSLLVMGAYEHSKFREDFFGGDTAKVLQKSEIPVLLSH